MREDGLTMRPRIALLAIALAAAVPAVSLAAAVARVHVYARRSTANVDPDGSTIVVFGAQALEHGPAASLRARLDHAITLYRARPGRRLAMAGGVPISTDSFRGGHDEVAAMTDYARAHGVPANDVMEVRPGQNTREQVASARRVVVDAGLGPVIAVSSSYHLARIHDEARRQGFSVAVSAPRRGPDVSQPRQYAAHVLADGLGLLWYSMPDALARRVDTSAGSLRHVGIGVLAGRHSWRDILRSGGRGG